MSHIVPASYLHLLQSFVNREYSVDISKTLQSTEFSLPDDPMGFISHDHFVGACAIILKDVSDPALGLKYGNQLSFISHGPLGAAMMSCGNVADLIELIMKFINTRFLFKIEMIPGVTKTTFLIHCAPPCLPNIVFHSQCILAGTFQLLLEIVGVIPEGSSIDFPYPEPKNVNDYKTTFPTILNFKKPHLAINLPSSFMEYCLPRHDETSKKMFVNMCEHIKKVMANKQNLSGVISEMLDAYDSYPSLEQVAQNLNISGRTLRTHLKKEDTNFRNVLSSHRIQRSKLMLINTNTNIDVIANKLGYSDAANFNRAFKKEMSMAPTTYRKQHKKVD